MRMPSTNSGLSFSTSTSTFTYPYESPFNSRDHLLAEHSSSSSSSSYQPQNLKQSQPSRAREEGTPSESYISSTEMAWFTIRNDNWTGGFAQRHPSHSHSQARRLKMSKTRRVKLFRSYAFDWVLCIVLAAIFFALDEIPGFKRQFSIENTSLRFPYAEHERVPPIALYFICGVAPFVIQIAVNLLTVRSFWDFHNGSLGLLLSLTLTGAITQFTKVTVGRPRPDVISRCQPPSGVTNPEYGLVSVEICTQTDVHIIRDGFRSFPSGHSSLSFAGLGFLSFYLAGKMHLFDEKGHTSKAWISLTPLSGAALVAISRTMDYRHHWQDVLVGSLLGLTMSFFAYRQYYPPLSSPRSHRPFSPRIRREGSDGVDNNDLRGGGGELEERSPSEESHAPILPVHRPGVGAGVGGGRKAGPFCGRSGEDGDGDGDGRVITHPAIPHIHPIHGGHPNHPSQSSENGGGGYLHPRYQDQDQDEHIEDLRSHRGSVNSLSTLGPNITVGNREVSVALPLSAAERRVGSGSGSSSPAEEDGLEMNSPLKGVGIGSR